MREKIPDSNISECNNLQVDIFLLKVEHCERKLGANFFHKQRFFTFIYLFIYLFIYVWLCSVFIAVHGLSQVAASQGLLFVAVCRLLIVVVSLVAEHGL